MLFLSIDVVGHRRPNSKNPHIMVDTLTTAQFLKIVGDACFRTLRIGIDKHVFLITKPLSGETVDYFYGNLKN